MSEQANHFRDTIDRVFREQVDRDFLFRQEQEGWPGDLWELVCELGIETALLAEDKGGVGADWADFYEIASAAGRYAVPLPLGETVVARWVLGLAGAKQPSGAGTLVYAPTLERVPWGRDVQWGLWQCPGEAAITLIRWTGELCDKGSNIAREPRDHLQLTSIEQTSLPVHLQQDSVLYLGALLRAAAIAGGAFRLLEKANEYAQEREQFGRTLNKFQAVQHNLARLAAWSTSIDAAARCAYSSIDTSGIPDAALMNIAAAKYRASELASQVCSTAHQIHGAIGFTYEHDLHFFTRRLWAWSAEFGGSGYWADYLGSIALAEGADGIWRRVTAGRVDQTS